MGWREMKARRAEGWPASRAAGLAACAAVLAAAVTPAPARAAPTSSSTGVSACDSTCCAGDVRALLARAEARYDSLSSLRAAFEQVVEVPLMDRKREGHGTWYQEGRARFRMDFSEPPHDLIVADGRHLWLYYPSTNPGQVVRTTLEGDPTGAAMVDLEGRIFREARKGYRARLAGHETIDDVTTCQVDLEPGAAGASAYRRVRVWVGARDHLVRKFEITEENETVRTITLTRLEPDASIPDSLFRFEVPAGVDVFSG